LLLASSASLFFNSVAEAAAFQLYELGTPIVATAGVGQAAVASDASTVYFNPAGMAVLSTSQMMLGSEMLLPYANFSPNSSNTISGNNGGNAGMLSPMISGYYMYNFSPDLKLGFGLTSPYGGALNYNTNWVGRYSVQQMTLLTINFNPALSYKLLDWLALGAGVSVEYASLYQTLALRLNSTSDGQASLNVDNTAEGFNLGMLLIPTQSTKIGIAYRSQIVHHLSGNLGFLNISNTPTATTKLVMPANIIASISQGITDQFTLLGEFGWSNWSSMRDSIVTVNGYSGVTPENWNNTYRVGIGGQYKISQPVLLQAGASYDSSPTTSTQRTPNLPMDKQLRIGVGLEYSLNRVAVLGLSYEYFNLGSAPINNTSSVGTLAGSYSRNYTNVFQASLNVAC